MLFTLIAECYAHQSIIVTSNVAVRQWDQIFQGPAGGIMVAGGRFGLVETLTVGLPWAA